MTEPYKTTVVRIMGEDYPIRSDAEPDYVNELAQYVEDKIVTITSKTHLPPPLKGEVLAALVIADEYFSEKHKNEEIKNKMIQLQTIIEENLKNELAG
jgi:cell division protein ZapA